MNAPLRFSLTVTGPRVDASTTTIALDVELHELHAAVHEARAQYARCGSLLTVTMRGSPVPRREIFDGRRWRAVPSHHVGQA